MIDYVKEPHTTIFTGPTGRGKTEFVLHLIEKEYNKHFDYIIIICPTLRWNKTYHSRNWIKYDDKVWLTEPKDIIRVRCNRMKPEKFYGLYYWVEGLSRLLAHSETLFIIDDVITDLIKALTRGGNPY